MGSERSLWEPLECRKRQWLEVLAAQGHRARAPVQDLGRRHDSPFPGKMWVLGSA